MSEKKKDKFFFEQPTFQEYLGIDLSDLQMDDESEIMCNMLSNVIERCKQKDLDPKLSSFTLLVWALQVAHGNSPSDEEFDLFLDKALTFWDHMKKNDIELGTEKVH
tara:strand:- start:147 stop:467 length:321 start_codon:yes stop_codon:yes gene_type:complete